MKRIGTALTIVFIIAGFAISFFIGHYVSDKSHTESRAAQFDKYISRAIDTIKDKGLSIDGAPEAIASNIWVAHEFCDSPEISAELSNLWNTGTILFDNFQFVSFTSGQLAPNFYN